MYVYRHERNTVFRKLGLRLLTWWQKHGVPEIGSTSTGMMTETRCSGNWVYVYWHDDRNTAFRKLALRLLTRWQEHGVPETGFTSVIKQKYGPNKVRGILSHDDWSRSISRNVVFRELKWDDCKLPGICQFNDIFFTHTHTHTSRIKMQNIWQNHVPLNLVVRCLLESALRCD